MGPLTGPGLPSWGGGRFRALRWQAGMGPDCLREEGETVMIALLTNGDVISHVQGHRPTDGGMLLLDIGDGVTVTLHPTQVAGFVRDIYGGVA